jgi:colanic acid/amylovoran biosynthesis glycosyltransferase
MKIAFIVYEFPSITQTFILRQITGLLDRGHEVDIFAYSSDEHRPCHQEIEKYDLLGRTYYLASSSKSRIARVIQRFGLLVTSFKKDPIALLRTLNVFQFGRQAAMLHVAAQTIPFLGRGPYHIVHCQFGPLGELGLLLRDLGIFKGRLITSFRGYDISSYLTAHGYQTYSELFVRGDVFLCVSEHIRKKLIRLGCDPRKTLVHRSGVEVSNRALSPSTNKKDRKIRVLTIARLVEKKGIEYGIRAVAKILETFDCVDYEIAGEGPLKDGLQSLIEQLRWENKIRLIGWKTQAEIADLLTASDILLAPSVTAENGDEEGIPGVIMEAFAKGLPVVSTSHAGIPEVVRDGASGFLVPQKDVDAIAERLLRLVDDPKMRSRMGQSGREFVKEHFDIQKLNVRLEKIYQEAVKDRML